MNRCLLAENADYSYSLMSGMAKVTSPFVVPESTLGIQFWRQGSGRKKNLVCLSYDRKEERHPKSTEFLLMY